MMHFLREGCQIIGFDFRYLYVNDAVARHGRKSGEELLGHTMMELYPGIEGTHMFSVLKRCMEERTAAELENEFTYQDGSTAWFTLRMEPVPEGVFILSIDVSERKRAEIELQNHLRRIEALREIDLAIVSTTNLSVAMKTVLEQVTGSLNVDVLDALSYDRPYRKAWPQARVVNHIREQAGRHFDPRAVELFLQVLNNSQEPV
ncbi:MAG: PAS domain-containing protein [Deltaproteobacteria bacterium]|nr:PAS domain-containing protein [Deltaproteobacteria bacterium]